MLEKCALLKIAAWRAPARSSAAEWRTVLPGSIVSVSRVRRICIATTAVRIRPRPHRSGIATCARVARELRDHDLQFALRFEGASVRRAR
jgi:hypothetical protein